MGRSGVKGKSRRTFGMPTRGLGAVERSQLVGAIGPQTTFAVLTAARLRGELELVIDGDEEAARTIARLVEEETGRTAQVSLLTNVQSSPVELAAMLEGDLLVDRANRWDALKDAEEEVRDNAERDAADASREAWAFLDSLVD